jgi:hypothetical protein
MKVEMDAMTAITVCNVAIVIGIIAIGLITGTYWGLVLILVWSSGKSDDSKDKKQSTSLKE